MDSDLPWNEITLKEFGTWCDENLQLPKDLVYEIFGILDTRREKILRRQHLEMLLGVTDVTPRVFGQFLDSALGGPNAAFEKADSEGNGDGRLSFEEMKRLSRMLGVKTENVALLFSELDVDKVGFLTQEQFKVMSKPNHVFRLRNIAPEENRFQIYEMRLYKDDGCLTPISCDLPIASGNYVRVKQEATASSNASNQSNSSVSNATNVGPNVNGSAGDAETTFEASSAFDGSLSTRWISECEQCAALSAWIGCKFDEPLEVRCVELFQTPQGISKSGRRLDLAKVASGFRMETWSGKIWNKMMDVVKPPLWEIDNFGLPLSFKPPVPAAKKVIHEVFIQIDEKEAQEFEEKYGLSLDTLLILGVALIVFGLLCFCVICPNCLAPRCLREFRRNAPERMDQKKAQKFEDLLAKKREIEALEQVVFEHSRVVDEWGIVHRIHNDEQIRLEKKLEHERRKKLKLEKEASSGSMARKSEKKKSREKRREHLERLRRMREAYLSKTIAIDGMAIRAPPAVLLELGFEPEMIEAFGLPGFSTFDGDGNLQVVESADQLQDALDREEAMEGRPFHHHHHHHHERKKSDAGEQLPGDADSDAGDDESESSEEDEKKPSGVQEIPKDDGTLLMPPQLDEITAAVAREGAVMGPRKRRGALLGIKEGTPMTREAIREARRIASSLKVGGQREEADEVDAWLEGNHATKDDPSQNHVETIHDWESAEADTGFLVKEKQKEEKKKTMTAKRMSAFIGAAAGDDDDDDDTAKEARKANAKKLTEDEQKFLEAEEEDSGSEKEIHGPLGEDYRSMQVYVRRDDADPASHKPKAAAKSHHHKSHAIKSDHAGKNAAIVKHAGSGKKESPKKAEADAAGPEDGLLQELFGEAVEEQDEAEAYQGKVYPGMPVRPRGLGTPRHLQFAGEVYRSSLDAPEVRRGGGLPWGMFATSKPHWTEPEEAEEKNAEEDQAIESSPLQIDKNAKKPQGKASSSSS
eukprot:TRINITY_DN12020_c3_g1_i1.p1 TRINITY_DN12020_c3_g1~~TRINITY_DN12020_c3_g1_i1.p1  ORF type:complete len:1033 (-),score=245.74 TRINITY_DN12020_c3_g1_i1:107-3052(-)